VAEGCENAASVEPACGEFAEDVVPIEIAGFELAGGGVAAVGNSYRAAHAKTALGKIQAVPRGAPDTVVGDRFDELCIHASLQDEILQQTADVVVGKSSADGGL